MTRHQQLNILDDLLYQIIDTGDKIFDLQYQGQEVPIDLWSKLQAIENHIELTVNKHKPENN